MRHIFVYSSRLTYIQIRRVVQRKYEGVTFSRASGKLCMFRQLLLDYVDLMRIHNMVYNERKCYYEQYNTSANWRTK